MDLETVRMRVGGGVAGEHLSPFVQFTALVP